MLIVNISYAQLPVITTTSLAGDPSNDVNFLKNGNYAIDVNNERDQYVGLWRYQDNGILFELKIEKKNQYINKVFIQGITSYHFFDVLTFKYKLIKNNVLIYDNLNQTIPEDYISIATKYGVDNYAYGGFLDATRNVCAKVSITKTNTNPEKIFFDLSSGAYYLLNPISYYEGHVIPLFNVPTNGIEMLKVD